MAVGLNQPAVVRHLLTARLGEGPLGWTSGLPPGLASSSRCLPLRPGSHAPHLACQRTCLRSAWLLMGPGPPCPSLTPSPAPASVVQQRAPLLTFSSSSPVSGINTYRPSLPL